MKALDDYLAAEAAVHEYFGYAHGWREYAIRDQRDKEWLLSRSDSYVAYAEKLSRSAIDSGDALYGGEVRGEPYRGAEYTAIVVDTNCDQNVVLMVFTNAKQVTDPATIEYYEESW